MIVVYDAAEKDFASLGLAVLRPTLCEVTEEAGGDFALKLTHPIDSTGEWAWIQPFNLIKVPMPLFVTPFVSAEDNTILTAGVEVWRANDSCWLYSSKAVSYPAWQPYRSYSAGDRVTRNGQNWVCRVSHGGMSDFNTSFWTAIAAEPVRKRQIAASAQVYVTVKETNWLTVVLKNGEKGFCKRSEFTYLYTLSEDAIINHDIPEREISEQVFRIMDVTIDSAKATVTANAKHISYDYSFQLVNNLTLDKTNLADAVAALRVAVLGGGVNVAPNIYVQGSAGTKITGTYNLKTTCNCLLDPDIGLVAQSKKMLIRDNREFFLLNNTAPDRGFSLVYGVNLSGVTWKRDFSRLVTRVLPVAKNAGGNPYYIPSPDTYTSSERINDYPMVMYKAITVDAQIGKDGATEADVIAQMQEEAGNIFSKNKEDLPVTTLSVDFLMLGDTEEYARYRKLERLSIYDTVEVQHPDLGLSTSVQVKGYTWDAIAERYTRITLGDVFDRAKHTVTGYDLSDGCITTRKLSLDLLRSLQSS